MKRSKDVHHWKDSVEGRRRAIPWFIGLMGILLFLCSGASPARGDFSRPAPEQGPTRVMLKAYFLDVTEIQSAKQSFTANVYVEARWRDERLAHRDLVPIRKNLEAVWNPRLQIVNRRNITRTLPDLLEISPEGEVLYRQRVWGDFSQHLDLRDFPMDRQVLTIQIVAAGYSTKEVDLVPDQVISRKLSEGSFPPDWEVEEWNAEVVPLPDLRGKGQRLSVAEFSFTARRNMGYYIIQVIIPLILIVAMSWVVFWIDPKEAGIQIGVSMTAMLTLIAYRFAVGADLPKVSYVTRMDLFLLGATVLVFVSLVEVIITSTLAKREQLETARRIDRWSRILFPLLFALVTARAFLI